ncbi:hypothetical protein QJS04_geneDACA006375 [Acorus gramineus]|uniref:DNA-directed RNA polymerase III subunit RPC5 n=1 Tax=Acorus gramineus TaxID=55184 RepID=A0AAV9AYM0_ACOGR|nr:hypothetical protein QJS04_geneDACA006375 [Acorus gramineus]
MDDLGDADLLGDVVHAPRVMKFRPKSKLKPKPPKPEEPEAVAKAEPPPEDARPPLPPPSNKPETEEKRLRVFDEALMFDGDGSGPMEIDVAEDDDDGEDCVVREIDVFFNPNPFDSDAQLYIMQYPLRPCWRPYELDQRCQEVRVKPEEAKIEVDLSIDTMCENYNSEAPEMAKQTLFSIKAGFATSYAVGILMENKLHLNPVHAVVQLRPSTQSIEFPKKEHAPQNVDNSVALYEVKEAASVTSLKGKGKMVPGASDMENLDVAEPWIPLEYYSADTPLCGEYQQRMRAEEANPEQFFMSPFDYISSLCPTTSMTNNGSRGPLRRELLSLSLEERFKKWFSEGSPVNRFNALMHLAPSETPKDVLKVIQQHAYLVQGLWVSKSLLLYGGGPDAMCRDYILCLFTKSTSIRFDQLTTLRRTRGESFRRIMEPLAVERSKLQDYKFKEPTDLSFIKDSNFEDVRKEQERQWLEREKRIMGMFTGQLKPNSGVARSSVRPNMATQITAPGKVDRGAKGDLDRVLKSGTRTMSEETREALPRALKELFRTHKVCSVQLIRQGLRDMALSKSAHAKAGSRATVTAASGAEAPDQELQSVISQVGINIHGVYVLKSRHPSIDPLRDLVIKVFIDRGPNARLKKADIFEAARSYSPPFSDSMYSQVLNELCISNESGEWMIKSGDGKI